MTYLRDPHAKLLTELMLDASRAGNRLWRNNVAKAWIGRSIRISESMNFVVHPGDVVVRQARRLHAGLAKGSADLIGFTQHTINGEKVAIFTAIEAKTGTGRLLPAQSDFLVVVSGAGGLGGEVYSVEDYRRLIGK